MNGPRSHHKRPLTFFAKGGRLATQWGGPRFAKKWGPQFSKKWGLTVYVAARSTTRAPFYGKLRTYCFNADATVTEIDMP